MLIRDSRRRRAAADQRVARGAAPVGTACEGATEGGLGRGDGGAAAPRQDALGAGGMGVANSVPGQVGDVPARVR